MTANSFLIIVIIIIIIIIIRIIIILIIIKRRIIIIMPTRQGKSELLISGPLQDRQNKSTVRLKSVKCNKWFDNNW